MSRCKAVRQFPLIRRWLFLIPVTSLVLAGCRDDSLITEPDLAPDLSVVTDEAGVSQDDWIVVFRDDTFDPPGLARRLVAENGGTIRHTYTHALKGFAGSLPPQAIEGIRRNPQVAYVEPDGIATYADVGSWGLDRIDQRYLDLDGQFNSPWTGAGATAYILDTGIDFATYDGSYEFGNRLSSGWDFIQNDSDASDCQGHGTHVAGTVGSATYGVAKAVKLVSVRVLGCNGSGSWSQIIAGIDWVAADHHNPNSLNYLSPAVANMSIQGDFYRPVNDAITNAVAGGVTFAVAAGNYHKDACRYSPASTPTAITVGATTITDQRSYFSNYGACLDLFAPGSDILSTLMGGGVGLKSGTSMATPHVAGVAALWLQSNPAWSPDDVWTAIQEKSTPGVVFNPGTGSPNLLLYSGEIATGGDPPPENQAPTAAFDFTTDYLTVVFTDESSDSDGSVVDRDWDFGDGVSSSTRDPSHTYSAPGTYTVTLTVTDDDGASSDTQRPVTVSAPPENDPPTASFTYDCTELSCAFDASGSSDSDGSIQSYAWNFGDGHTDSGMTTSHTYAAGNTYTVTLSVTDDDQTTATTSHNVSVTAPPSDLQLLSAFTRGNNKVVLNWVPASMAVDIWRAAGTADPDPLSEDPVQTGVEGGSYTDTLPEKKPSGPYSYMVCEVGDPTNCSAAMVIVF